MTTKTASLEAKRKQKNDELFRKVRSESFERSFNIETRAIDEEARTVELAFSSEEPYERFFGIEVLGHKSEEIRTDRLKNAPLLVNHDIDRQVGVIEKFSIDADRVARSVVRFGRSQYADEIFKDVIDGIRTQVSVGYRVHEMELVSEKEGVRTFRVTDWEPFENSIVAIAADNVGAGVGRSDEDDSEEVEEVINETIQEAEKMSEKDEAATVELERKHQQEIENVRVSAGEDAVEQERQRVAEIDKLAERFDAQDLARDYILDSKKTANDFKDAIMERNVKEAEETSPDIGMSKKEVKRFSWLRAMRAMAFPQNARLQEAAAFERECSEAAADDLEKEPEGFMIPNDILRSPLVDNADYERLAKAGVDTRLLRDLTVGTATAGGHTVATDLLAGSFIDLLRNRIVVANMATMLTGLRGNIAIPRQTSAATSAWVAESVAATESQQAFDQVTMQPLTNSAWTEYSRKLLLQSSIDIEAFVRSDLVTILALAIDLAAINGSGTGSEPEGILNTTGIGDVAGGANGLAPAWSHIVDLETEVAQDNADVGRLGYVSNAKVRGALKQTEKASSTAQFILDGNTTNGYNMMISNQVPDDLDKGTSTGVCSAIIFGNFADLIIGQWGGLDLLVDPFSNSTTGVTRVVVFQDVDVAVRHPESFAAMQDALTA